ncbi:MAG: sodium:alanine symporter family protein [bacterium]|nr:sodium:alanine symporter family protein [bacterium]
MNLESYLHTFNHYLTGLPEQFPWFVAFLLGTGIFVTLRLGFIQFRRLKHASDVVAGKYDNPDDEGDVTHFQALTVALSATVGVGNIAGVAIAIHWAGPGAIFWMWMTAIFGMALKYAECTLAIKYREFDDQGNAAGGPMYYIEKGLGIKWPAIFFSICAVICSFGTGNMAQSNTIASVSKDIIAPALIGLILAVVVGAVIIGGVKRIASVTDKLLPGMAILYFGSCALILLMHMGDVPAALMSIFENAFSTKSAFGGTAAAGFSAIMLKGVQRGLFSNEAGQGSAPIAHASAKTDEPVREGLVAMTGPLIDTLIICTLTASTILVTGVWNQKFEQKFDYRNLEVASSIVGGSPVLYSGNVQFVDGVLQTHVFEYNHASIDEHSLKLDGKLFSGTVAAKNGNLMLPEGDFSFTGKALLTGANLTAKAFKIGLSSLINWGDWIVDFSVLLFALSTIIGWSYYGDRSFQYLFGVKYLLVYRILYLAFVFIGSITALDIVWAFGDIALSLMTIPNLMAVLLLSGVVVNQTNEYFTREHKPFK